MSPALIYWVVVAGVGVPAAIGSFIIGLRFLRKMKPEVQRHFWPETVRDSLLVLGLALNLLVGILAINPSPMHNAMAQTAILGSATSLSVFAVFNFILRLP